MLFQPTNLTMCVVIDPFFTSCQYIGSLAYIENPDYNATESGIFSEFTLLGIRQNWTRRYKKNQFSI